MIKVIPILLVFTVIACSPAKDDKVISESIKTHEAALKVGEEVRESIKRIELSAESLNETQKALVTDSVNALKEDVTYWESLMAESPSYEDEHHEHDGHDHDHDHDQLANLTPEMILDIQRDLHDQALQLDARSKRLLETIEN